MRVLWRNALAWTALSAVVAPPALCAATPELVAALSEWAAPEPLPAFKFALVDLNSDTVLDAIVLFKGPRFCGSGGCNMVVFKGVAKSFDLVSHSTITREPIIVLKEQRFGWRSLSVAIGGGGAEYGQVLMHFNGEEYPLNPTLQSLVQISSIEALRELRLEEGR